jgi:hypothetical protein
VGNGATIVLDVPCRAKEWMKRLFPNLFVKLIGRFRSRLPG